MSNIAVSSGVTDLQGFKRYIERKTMETAHLVLEEAANLLLTYVHAYSGSLAAPLRHQSQARRAHTGGWGDVSDDLRDKYYTRIEYIGDGWRMTIGNTSQHAIYVEARDGLLVVHGLLDQDGPINQILRVAAKRVGADWEVKAVGEINIPENPGWAPVSNLPPGGLG